MITVQSGDMFYYVWLDKIALKSVVFKKLKYKYMYQLVLFIDHALNDYRFLQWVDCRQYIVTHL